MSVSQHRGKARKGWEGEGTKRQSRPVEELTVGDVGELRIAARDWQERNGLTVSDMAVALELSPPSYSDFVKGKTKMHAKNRRKLLELISRSSKSLWPERHLDTTTKSSLMPEPDAENMEKLLDSIALAHELEDSGALERVIQLWKRIREVQRETEDILLTLQMVHRKQGR